MTAGSGPSRRFGKFALVGAVGAAFQVVLFRLLVELFDLPQVWAAPIAVEIVLLHNFLWHERFTWRDRGSGGIRQRTSRLWWFHVTNGLLSLGGNTALIYVLVQELKAPALPSAVAAIALCAPANFLLADRCVYRKTVSCAPHTPRS
jgi:dolichol-phosphate mannosyltransferase